MTDRNMQPLMDGERQFGRQFNCDCGATVESYGGLDTWCDRCHREFNAFGQLLAPRDQWEDTY